MMNTERVVLALPSKGALAEPTSSFLAECGLQPERTGPRQYSARIPAFPEVSVLLQRAWDIVQKVADGTADIGITGLDIVSEDEGDGSEVVLLHEGLGYGQCDLVLAVPETWIDVDSLADVADVALDFRETRGRDLRVATRFPNLTRQFLLDNGVACFAVVAAQGAVEAAPSTGYAEMIADLSSTGTTLRANHLKPLAEGPILSSQACLIANSRSVRERRSVTSVALSMLEIIDATLMGRQHSQVTASVVGVSAQDVARRLLEQNIIGSRDQYAITPLSEVASREVPGHYVSLTVRKARLLPCVACLREMGATNVLVTPVRYHFTDQSESCARMLALLRGGSDSNP